MCARKYSWDVRYPVILNLHLFLWDSYIAYWMSGRHCAAEGRREAAVTHLAWLGVKIAGNGILGVLFTKENEFYKRGFAQTFRKRT